MSRSIVFSTEKSSLSVSMMEDNELMERCIIEISEKMLVRPPITIFGKVCNQNRDIYFSAKK